MPAQYEQRNQNIRPQLTLEQSLRNDESELLAAFVYGVQVFPNRFHKNTLRQDVPFDPWFRLIHAIGQFTEAGFTFSGIKWEPGTAWQATPTALISEDDRTNVPKILEAIRTWKQEVLGPLYDRHKDALEPLVASMTILEGADKAPLSMEEGRKFTAKSLMGSKKMTPEDKEKAEENKKKELEAQAQISALASKQRGKLKDLNPDKIMTSNTK